MPCIRDVYQPRPECADAERTSYAILSAMSHPPVVVKRGLSGLGLFATTDLTRDDFILTYEGERISPEEADRRGGKYLFTVSKTCVIDGKDRTNIARYINHSCRPNCYAEADEEAETISFYAKKRIKAGEELTYHYGKQYYDQMLAGNCRCPRCAPATTS